MLIFIVALILPFLFILAMVAVFIHRGRQFALLCKDGQSINGVILKKNKKNSRNRNVRYSITYRYIGWDGAEHHHTSQVSNEIYEEFDEGGSIELCVSKSKPSISAPEYLVAQCRATLNKSI